MMRSADCPGGAASSVLAYLVSDSSEDHSVGHERVAIHQPLCFWEILHWNSKHQLVIEPAHPNTPTKHGGQHSKVQIPPLWSGYCVSAELYSHVHVVDAQLAVEMLLNITAKPHSLRGGRRENRNLFSTQKQTGPALHPCPAVYLALLDGVACSLLQQLDGLIVVQCAAGPNHVTKKLNGVQLPVRILGSGVIHKADLLKQENVWNGM